MKKFFKTLWSVVYPILIVFAVMTAVTMAFTIIPALGGENIPENLMSFLDSTQAVNITLAANIVAIPILLLMVSHDNRKLGKQKHNSKFIIRLIYAVAAVAVSIIGNIVLNYFGLGTDDEAFNEVSQAMDMASPVLTLTLAVIVAPVVEEILFRGIVCRRLKSAWGPVWAVIISAVMFGLYHGNLTQGIYAAVLGAVLALAYVDTGSVVLCIIMHILGNLSAMILFV